MTHLRLHDHVSFCRAAGQLVLLDIRRDRYFRLPAHLEQALLAHLDGHVAVASDLDALVARGILTGETEVRGVSRSIPQPLISATECPRERVQISLGSCMEIFILVIAGRAELRFRPLHRILESLGDVAIRTTACPESALRAAVATFRRVRLFVPVELRCLVDSIALSRFLGRRGLDTRLVFGVALDPFSAHCWVQAGDLVLNDSVGNVTSHTPIRVV